jgi:hypothetical protein
MLHHIPPEEGYKQNFCSGEAEIALRNVNIMQLALK